MVFFRIPKRIVPCAVGILLTATFGVSVLTAERDQYYRSIPANAAAGETEKKYIKWVDFSVPLAVMERALAIDIKSQSGEHKVNWIELMAYLSAKYGGNYKSYKKSDMDNIEKRLLAGERMADIAGNMKLYNYYIEAYTAIFAQFVGAYRVEVEENGQKVWKEKYGLKAFSPIAKGYGYSHCDDFGNGRSYGYKRKHLGNDLMGSIGTPVVAVEGGIVEAAGWNMYGGWRVGIRSFDGKRYYYYAHLKKDHPFHNQIVEGQTVKAGDVIGYLGMTGYSTKENVNNINVPHLHFGLQLIFDESQKEGVNQIWIDVYGIVKFLAKNKSAVQRDPETKDFNRVYDIHDPSAPD